jgi:hypothetical protein
VGCPVGVQVAVTGGVVVAGSDVDAVSVGVPVADSVTVAVELPDEWPGLVGFVGLTGFVGLVGALVSVQYVCTGPEWLREWVTTEPSFSGAFTNE